jgi:hypothetical protein
MGSNAWRTTIATLIDTLAAAGVPDAEIDRLLDNYGGLPVYVPRSLSGDHALVALAGPAAAAVMVRVYGGERIVVPMGAAWRRARIVRRVAELRDAGLNHCEIARRLGLHVRQVQRLAAEVRSRKQTRTATAQGLLAFEQD